MLLTLTVGGGAVGVWTLTDTFAALAPASIWISGASIAVRHRGHWLLFAFTFDARHWRWNLWLHDKVRRGVPGAKAFRQIEQSSAALPDGEAEVADIMIAFCVLYVVNQREKVKRVKRSFTFYTFTKRITCDCITSYSHYHDGVMVSHEKELEKANKQFYKFLYH